MGLHRVTKQKETCTPRVKLLKYSALGVRRRRSLPPPLLSFLRNVSLTKYGLSKGFEPGPGMLAVRSQL